MGGLAGSAFPERTPAPPRPPGLGSALGPGLSHLGFGKNPTSLPPSHPRARGLPELLSPRCNSPAGCGAAERWLHPGASNGGVCGVRTAPFPSWGSVDTGAVTRAGAVWGRDVVPGSCAGLALLQPPRVLLLVLVLNPFGSQRVLRLWAARILGCSRGHAVPLPAPQAATNPEGPRVSSSRAKPGGFGATLGDFGRAS